MLVLTRKADEEILIGNDIKITLIRVRGNSVRIGIDAPREVRVVRGELESLDTKTEDDTEILSPRESVFAHPQPPIAARASRKNDRNVAQPQRRTGDLFMQATAPYTIEGRMRPASDEVKLTKAPLADFVSAT